MDIRDKALFSVLLYGWARVSAVVALKVEDYFERKGTHWLRFKEKRGKIHEVPVHSKAKEAIDQLIAASGVGSSAPLFPAFAPDKKSLTIDKKTGGLRHWIEPVSGSWCRREPRLAGWRKRYAATVFGRPASQNT